MKIYHKPITNASTTYSRFGDRCFAAAGPHIWNNLPAQSARQGSPLHRIQKTTENIHVSDGLQRIVTFLIIAPYKYSYLLTYLLAVVTYFITHNSMKDAAILNEQINKVKI